MIACLSLSYAVQNSYSLCLKTPYPSLPTSFCPLFFWNGQVKTSAVIINLLLSWEITILASDLRTMKACLLFCSCTYWFNTSLWPLPIYLPQHLPTLAKGIWAPHNEKGKKCLRLFLMNLENFKLLLRYSDNNNYFPLIEVGNVHIIPHIYKEVIHLHISYTYIIHLQSPFHQWANVLEHCGRISVLFIWFDFFVRHTEKDCDNLIECRGETEMSCGQGKEEQPWHQMLKGWKEVIKTEDTGRTGVKLGTEDKCGQTEDSTHCEQQVWDK